MGLLTQQAIDSFHSRGLLCFRNFLPPTKVEAARQVCYNCLEKEGIRRNGAWFLKELSSETIACSGRDLIKGLKHSPEIAELVGGEVQQVVSELLNQRPTISIAENQVLFTLPNSDSWTIPHNHWHVDFPRFGDGGTSGVQVFTFLETVVPGGGGTLVVTGSHRFANNHQRVSSQQVKKILRREPFFRSLMSDTAENRRSLLEQSSFAGSIEVQVVELHGEPGDVYFTDLRLLHTIAPNATQTPRIMLTQRYLLESCQGSLVVGNEGRTDEVGSMVG